MRHLHSRGLEVRIVLDGDESTLSEAAHNQLQILEAAGMHPINLSQVSEFLRRSELVVDALIAYGLRGAPRGETANLIDLRNRRGRRVLSLDVPSGLSATTAEALSSVVRPDRTATLTLPKTGLQGIRGDLYLADIGIPLEVYHGLRLPFQAPSEKSFSVRLISTEEGSSPAPAPPGA